MCLFGVLFSWFVLYDVWFGSLFVFVFIVMLLGRFALGLFRLLVCFVFNIVFGWRRMFLVC